MWVSNDKKVTHSSRETTIGSIFWICMSPLPSESNTRKSHLKILSGWFKYGILSVAKITSRNPINFTPQPLFLWPYNLKTVFTKWSQSSSVMTSIHRFLKTWGPTYPVGYWFLNFMYSTWIWVSVKSVCWSKTSRIFGGHAKTAFNLENSASECSLFFLKF